MRRIALAFMIASTASPIGSVADAKEKPKKPIVVQHALEVVKPDVVDKSDAEEALVAAKALNSAQWAEVDAKADLDIKRMVWLRARERVMNKYGIDLEAGDGWDEQPDGKLKVRKGPKKVEVKK